MGVTNSSEADLAHHWNDVHLLCSGRKDINPIHLSGKAAVLRKLSPMQVWQNFLGSTVESFALTVSEMTGILMAGGLKDSKVPILAADIGYYITMFSDLSDNKGIDFMAVCSSILFVGPLPVEEKIDQLYSWIDLPDVGSIGFDDLLIAICSFEKGLSLCMEKHACSEHYIRNLTAQWATQANSSFKGNVLDIRIDKKMFFEFCSNRHFPVRRLLEYLAGLPLASNNANVSLEEVGVSLCSTGNSEEDELLKGPVAGDEWMANPAWKKTAEKMTPKHFQASKRPPASKPNVNMSLDWIHGYRGFDCRNNIRYVDTVGSSFVTHTAGMTVLQQQDASSAEQSYFGEHSDDIISIAIHEPKEVFALDKSAPWGDVLVATGEIGKTPAIHVYKWRPKDKGVKQYESLCLLEGYHKKGVCQLAFSEDGNVVYSVGVEYSIAVYNVCSGSKGFGKVITSIEGPKNKILHICASAGNGGGLEFVTGGDKHITFWTIAACGANGGPTSAASIVSAKSSGSGFSIKSEVVGLGTYKSKTYMCFAQLHDSGKRVVCGNSDGDVLLLAVSGKGKRVVVPLGGSHKGSVNAIWSHPGGSGFITGGKGGTVFLWNCGDENTLPFIIHQFTVSDYCGASLTPPASVPPVRSVCISQDGKKAIIGTQTCEVLEYVLPAATGFWTNTTGNTSSKSTVKVHPTGTILLQGHFKDEVWGLSVCPSATTGKDTEYCTVGDDGFLRIWKTSTRKMVRFKDLGSVARCCAYSPDGLTIAIGFGGGNSRSNKKKADNTTGVIRIYRNDAELTQLFESREAKQWISDIKFSADGRTLGIGAHDNNIYLYNVTQQYKRKGKFSKHNASISHFDFSANGKYVQTNCNAYELLFCDASNGQQITNGASSLTGVDWATETCILHWSTQGIWSGTMDGSDVNACSRSPSGQLIATADDFGKVKLFRYPALLPLGKSTESAPCNVYTGHSSHVTNVRWIGDKNASDETVDRYLISVGGEDKSVFQWRVNLVKEDDLVAATSSSTRCYDEQVDDHGDMEEMEGPVGGDEFMAVKPWLGAIVPPTAWSSVNPANKTKYIASLAEFVFNFNRLTAASNDKGDQVMTKKYEDLIQYASSLQEKTAQSGVVDPSPPEDLDELELDWVHGYRGYDCRNNIRYVPMPSSSSNFSQHRILYHAAALGIVYTYNNNEKGSVSQPPQQKFFRGHTDDILAMTLLPQYATAASSSSSADQNSTIVATGQQGPGNVLVWDVATLRTISVLPTKQKTVVQLCFAAMGRLLISIAQDNTVVISDWKNQHILSTTKGDPAVTFHMAAPTLSYPGSLLSPESTFLTCGDKFIRLWTITGKNLTSSKVSTSANAKLGCSPQSFWVTIFVKCLYIIGCDDGSLYVTSLDGKTVASVMQHHAISTGSTTAVAAKGKKSAPAKGGKGGKKAKVPSISSLYADDANHRFISGAKDGSIVIWDTSVLNPPSDPKSAGAMLVGIRLYGFSVQTLDSGIFATQIQSLCLMRRPKSDGTDETVLVVGTRGCDIVEVLLPAMTSADESGISTGGVAHLSSSGSQKNGVIMRSHCNAELWGLTTHPFLPRYCTTGDDKTCRFFDAHDHSQIGCISLGAFSRAVAYHPNGLTVAVGFGGRVGNGKESGGGMVRIYSADPLPSTDGSAPPSYVLLAEATEIPKQWVSDIKFSPDGSTLAVGAHDNRVHLYTVTYTAASGSARMRCSLKLKCKFSKHNASISHFDFSADGKYLQSNCNAYELLFSDTSSGKQITSASQLKDVSWSSWTCTLGWPVQGIWSGGMDGSDINSACRSFSGHLIATGDDFGLVNLFRYPAADAKNAKPSKFQGHSSHVMNVRWSCGDEFLISVGGEDKCIFQWKHTMLDSGGQTGEKSGTAVVDPEFTMAAKKVEEEVGDFDGLDIGELTGGDEFMAIKPWLGAIRAPSRVPPVNSSAPSIQLDVQWVHGYTSGFASTCNCRMSNNLWYNISNEFVYPAAALGVIMKKEANASSSSDITAASHFSQRYFKGHNDDVLCMTISTNRRYIASGQCASLKDATNAKKKGKGSVYIWDASEGTVLSSLPGCHMRAVVLVAFSPNSDFLVSVGQDDNNTHILWKDVGGVWSRVQQIASSKGDKGQMFFCRWLHFENEVVAANEYHFVSGGGSSFNFWKVDGASLTKKPAKFSGKFKKCPVLCAANMHTKDGWRVVCGTSTGDLFVLKARDVVSAVEKAHTGPVLCMSEAGEGTAGGSCSVLLTGSKDKTVKMWSPSLQLLSSFDASPHAVVDASIGSVDIVMVTTSDNIKGERRINTHVLVGTYGGEVIELVMTPGDSKSGQNDGKTTTVDSSDCVVASDFNSATVEICMQSHYSGELWGVATHPINPDIFATVGDDRSLRIWSISQRKMLDSVNLYWEARSVGWHPSGNMLAVGFHDAVKGGKKSSKAKANTDKKDEHAHAGAVHLYTCSALISAQMPNVVKRHTSHGTTSTIVKRADGCMSSAWISDVKFSPDGTTLVVGSHDKKIYVYDIPLGEFIDDSDNGTDSWAPSLAQCLSKKPRVIFNKHSSAITHFDYTSDSKYLQSTCQAYELLFMDLAKGKQVTSAASLANYNNAPDEEEEIPLSWNSQTCILGWPVQGIWPVGSNGSDINAVDKQPHTMNSGSKYIATSDDFGEVKVFHNPCTVEHAKYVSSCMSQESGGGFGTTAHSSHVTNVRWTCSGDTLVSVGGNDKCVMVWNIREL